MDERRVRGRARPWRARRASIAVNADGEMAGPNMAGVGGPGVGRPWESIFGKVREVKWLVTSGARKGRGLEKEGACWNVRRRACAVELIRARPVGVDGQSISALSLPARAPVYIASYTLHSSPYTPTSVLSPLTSLSRHGFEHEFHRQDSGVAFGCYPARQGLR